MNKVRTFVAVELADEVRDRAVQLIERLRSAGAEARWTMPQNMHLTLKFLGDVREDAVADVCRVVSKVAAEAGPFEIELGGAGAFPDVRRPRTLWIGVRRGHAELARLQTAVERALAKRGFPKDRRDYQPHLTIGRIRERAAPMAELGQLILEHANFAAGSCAIREAIVFASHLSATGPRYEPLARAPLGAGGVEPR